MGGTLTSLHNHCLGAGRCEFISSVTMHFKRDPIVSQPNGCSVKTGVGFGKQLSLVSIHFLYLWRHSPGAGSADIANWIDEEIPDSTVTHQLSGDFPPILYPSWGAEDSRLLYPVKHDHIYLAFKWCKTFFFNFRMLSATSSWSSTTQIPKTAYWMANLVTSEKLVMCISTSVWKMKIQC